jgi:hypothetical protein
MATCNACQTEYYLDLRNGGVKRWRDFESTDSRKALLAVYRPMNRYSASANNIGGFNCHGKKQPETMKGVGLPMKKLRPVLALVVPLSLLVSMPPLLLTHAQTQEEEGNDTWRLTMVAVK